MAKSLKELKPLKEAHARKKRGPRRFVYTTTDVAKLLGLSPTSVRDPKVLGSRISSLSEIVKVARARQISEKQILEFTWTQVAALLDTSEEEARAMARPVFRYLYNEGAPSKRKRKRAGREKVRDALFDPTDLRSLFDHVVRSGGLGYEIRITRDLLQ
jgi:hypothetical protein